MFGPNIFFPGVVKIMEDQSFLYQCTLCFTRLPLTSQPSGNVSFPCPEAMTECSPILATYCSSSVRTEGQLSFKYSNPSVCITAAKKVQQILLLVLLSKNALQTYHKS